MEEQPTLSATAPVAQGRDHDREKSIDDTAIAQKPSADAPMGPDGDVEYEYIVGVKLAVVMISVTLVAFLMMLDLAIISTVSHESPSKSLYAPDQYNRRFLASQVTSIPCPTWVGTVVRIF